MRRSPALPLCFAMLLNLAPALSAAEARLSPDDTLVYAGTYTGPKSQGIYLFRLRNGPGEPALESLGLAAETKQPSFLEIDPKRRLLFAVNESGSFDGKPTGSVSSFAIDAATGKLTRLSERASGGAGPCHLLLDRTGRNLLVANYSGGTVALLPVAADGRLAEAATIIKHAGKSVNPKRQAGPHAHQVALDPAQRFLFVCDLGLDKVMVYRFDAERHTLTPHEPAFVALKPGAGPRHLAFRPDGKVAYVLNELDSTITMFSYDAAKGRLTTIGSISTLPAGFTGSSSTAEILVHPSGKYAYASNRGHDSLAMFTINPTVGTLRLIGHQDTGGKTPRHFGLDPTGTLVAMGNQNSDTIVLARLDGDTGRLTPSPHVAGVPSPVCLVFLPPAGR
jgi:6-phosphogluconolactonase